MDRQAGRVEDLPELELREIRRLELEEPPGEGRPAHIASASGVVRRGDLLYVIGDDLEAIGVFRVSDPAPGALRRVLPGRAPGGGKPDLEALTLLPPTAEAPFGWLLGLGSGSQPGRDRAFACALEPDGSLRGEPRVIDLGPLYRLLGEHVEHLNVEGACVMGDRLWLLHRGNHAETTNVVAEVPLEELAASLRGDRRIDVHELAALRAYDLGELDGVTLTFSDATPVGREVLVFTASAEGDGHGRPDGAIRGSVVGTIDLDGRVQRMRTIDRRFKVEGVHASLDTGVVDLLFVCDQDDPDEAAPLLSASMPLDRRVEHPG